MNDHIKQEKLCTTCKFYGDSGSGWCTCFKEMPEYRCMAWEGEDKR